jgi:hypothetical protein
MHLQQQKACKLCSQLVAVWQQDAPTHCNEAIAPATWDTIQAIGLQVFVTAVQQPFI